MSVSSLPLLAVASDDPVTAELEKDIWNVRYLPVVHQSAHLLNFTKVLDAFRPLLKQYLRLLITRCALSGCYVMEIFTIPRTKPRASILRKKELREHE